MKHHRLLLFVLICFAALVCGDAFAKEIQGKCSLGRDYWLYVPDTVDPDKTYTLVVGVHGANGIGKGAAGHANWVKEHDVIVLGPSYRNSGGAYQYLQGQTDKQTIELFKQLQKTYKLHDKLFIVGFSGGSQYAHRFAMKYPELVSGCAAHSGGTWATGDYPRGESPNPKARGVLFVISCGEKDTRKSFQQAPFGRLEWAKKYEQLLEKGKFIYDAKWWSGVGHSYAKGARQQTLDCFNASTKLLPELDDESKRIEQVVRKKDYEGAWMIIKKRQAQAKEKGGIIGKVIETYVESLDKTTGRIDRWAEQKVRQARQLKDADQRRKALEAIQADYAGLPRTTKAVQKALAEFD